MPTSSEHSAHVGLWSDRRGAMFVMGIPICFFMIGLLYLVIGIGEDLVMRERMQDAADAGALTGALVYARGMNLIALLNQIMAALVGLLVMVRMLEAVLIAAITVAGALAWPTAGASLSIVPGAEVAREEANTAYDELKEVINPLVTALHYLEVGIQYGMPAVAELQTLSVVGEYRPVAETGFEVPGKLFLPLKNGTWPHLCKRAGQDAGALITMPLKPLIPVQPVLDVIQDGLGALTETFSDEFCGQGGGGLTIPQDLPSVPIKNENQFDERLPPLDSVKQCTDVTQKAASSSGQYQHDNLGLPTMDDAQQQQRADDREQKTTEYNETCETAAKEQAMADMAADGGPRVVHPSDPNAGPNDACTYQWGQNQGPTDCPADCKQRDGSACSLFNAEVGGAYDACRPGADPALVTWRYQRRDLNWVADVVPMPPCEGNIEDCKFNVKFRTPSPDYKDMREESKQPPCGPKPPGRYGTDYNRSSYHPDGKYSESDYLCSQPHTQVEPSTVETTQGQSLDDVRATFGINNADSHWTLNYDSGQDRKLIVTGRWSAVTFIHSCDRHIKNIQQTSQKTGNKQQAPNQSQCSSSNGGDSEDQVHLEMEEATEDNVLGGSDYQIRAIALRKADDSPAKQVVRSIPLRLRGDQQTESGNPLGAAGDALRLVFAAQAEYFFDTPFDENKPKEALDRTGADREEWVWNMAWKARLRRLRFLSDDDDDKSTCSAGWKSHGTVANDKGSSSGSSGKGSSSGSSGKGSSSGSSGKGSSSGGNCDNDPTAALTKQANDQVATSMDFNSAFGNTLTGSDSLKNTGLPGTDQSSASSEGCGAIGKMREFESLVIH